MEIYTYVHNILKGDLPTRASGRERPGQSSVHFGEIRSIAGLSLKCHNLSLHELHTKFGVSQTTGGIFSKATPPTSQQAARTLKSHLISALRAVSLDTPPLFDETVVVLSPFKFLFLFGVFSEITFLLVDFSISRIEP